MSSYTYTFGDIYILFNKSSEYFWNYNYIPPSFPFVHPMTPTPAISQIHSLFFFILKDINSSGSICIMLDACIWLQGFLFANGWPTECYSWGKSIYSFLSIPQLSLPPCLGWRPPESSPSHVSRSTGVILVEVLLRESYWWHLMGKFSFCIITENYNWSKCK